MGRFCDSQDHDEFTVGSIAEHWSTVRSLFSDDDGPLVAGWNVLSHQKRLGGWCWSEEVSARRVVRCHTGQCLHPTFPLPQCEFVNSSEVDEEAATARVLEDDPDLVQPSSHPSEKGESVERVSEQILWVKWWSPLHRRKRWRWSQEQASSIFFKSCRSDAQCAFVRGASRITIGIARSLLQPWSVRFLLRPLSARDGAQCGCK